ncbi:MAG: alkane 1-monooxygenase [Chitinophagales bacterium]|nr:alkane 1-monooxygenase [Chitinophagales bacterium]
MNIKSLKYLGVLISPIIIFICINQGGWYTWGGLVYAFVFVPLLDAILPSSTKNMSKVEEEMAKKDRIYDYMVYAIVPIQYFLVFYTMHKLSIANASYSIIEYIGYISSLGLACGVFGINVAHELGHRNKKYEQFLSKALLLTSLYMHFFIEHNRGHHKNVSTPDDPASSKEGEIVYFFWIRSVVGGYISAWHLENERLKNLGKSAFSINNEMIWYHLIQGSFLLALYLVFGWIPMLSFIASAIFGFLLLETVNYIEHYGLRRKKNEYGAWEKTLPIHSWNSNHPFGRILLFELTRHSDHHYIANRPYQILRHFDESPQMPTGYPGMMVISLIPPLWFWIMAKEIKKLKERELSLG